MALPKPYAKALDEAYQLFLRGTTSTIVLRGTRATIEMNVPGSVTVTVHDPDFYVPLLNAARARARDRRTSGSMREQTITYIPCA